MWNEFVSLSRKNIGTMSGSVFRDRYLRRAGNHNQVSKVTLTYTPYVIRFHPT